MVKLVLLKDINYKKLKLEMTSSKGEFEFFQLYNSNKKIYIQTSHMKVCEIYEHIMFCEFNDNHVYTQLLDKLQNMMQTKYENKFAKYGNKVKIEAI